MEGITGPRPVFEGLAYGYKLIFNYPYEDSYYAGDQAMPMLVENSTDHTREREREHEVAVGVRPIRY